MIAAGMTSASRNSSSTLSPAEASGSGPDLCPHSCCRSSCRNNGHILPSILDDPDPAASQTHDGLRSIIHLLYIIIYLSILHGSAIPYMHLLMALGWKVFCDLLMKHLSKEPGEVSFHELFIRRKMNPSIYISKSRAAPANT
ncbi:hypothetical protein GDO81_027256 [Engystomops pustulosus]|uniref:Uncharacterized protein n=1 Tax=Engystomops pustulosus TaxID=76066 RepID=A0AAV6YXW8_ENGPU|nr:hypothetical protein GDO81_027256 [Engystomops pustulosus]